MFYCPKCNKELEDGTKFCGRCGTALTGVANPVEKKSRPPVKILVIAAGAIVVIAAIILAVLFLIPKGNAAQAFAIYLKDNELNYTLTKKIDPFEITSSLYEDSMGENDAYGLAYITLISQDGNLIFFPDKVSASDSGFSLYYRYLNKPDLAAEKIDSDVTQYAVNDKADLVTYIKGDDRILYQNNFTDKEKIDSDVSYFFISSDGSKLIYSDYENNVYLKNGTEDKEKIDSNAQIQFVSKDLSKIYYLKDESLYIKETDQDKVKIASDVSGVAKIFESGEIYFYKSDSSDISLADYVEDDTKAADAALQQPIPPTYPESPSWWDYDTVAEYEQAYAEYEQQLSAYDAAYNAYAEAAMAYDEKLYRDQFREALAMEKMTVTNTSLYYYNGSEATEISDTFVEYSDISAADNAVMLFKSYIQSEVKKIKLAELEYPSEINEMVQAALYSSTEYTLAIGGKATAFEQPEVQYFTLNQAGTEIYYLDELDSEGASGELYKITIADGAAQKAESLDSDVSTIGMHFIDSAGLVYFKDVKDYTGEMYLDQTKIDYDVKIGSETFDKDQNVIVYFSDWDSEKQLGTLKRYANDESTKISDDVHAFHLQANADVLFLYDYSLTYSTGELRLYNGKKDNPKIDDDVTAIIPIFESMTRSIYYDGYYGD